MLRHLRDAAGPTTKLLLVDMVLPHACYDDWADGQDAIPGAERTLAPEGSPLLANLGRASANGYQLDLSVSVSKSTEDFSRIALTTITLGCSTLDAGHA